MTLLMPQAAIDADRPGWLARRTQGITGTDVACLLGISPHAGPYSLYHAKLDGIETEDKWALRRGRIMEPEVDDRLRDEHPHLWTRPAGLYANHARPWQMATLDREALNTEDAPSLVLEAWKMGRAGIPAAEPVEYKTWAAKDGWDDPGRGVIGDGNTPGCMPVQVRCQAIWNAHVYGAPSILVAVLWVMPGHLGVYRITLDDPGVRADLDLMTHEAGLFLRRLRDKDEPPVDDTLAATETLRKLHPDLTDTEVNIGRGLARRYNAARAAEAAAKARRRLVGNLIRQRMGPAARAVAPGPGGRLVTVCSRSKGDHPVTAHTRHDDKLSPGRWRP